MSVRQEIFAITVSLLMLFVIFELVRRRRLREEYSWLWIVIGFTIIFLVIRYDFLVAITNFIGAVLPTTTLFLFGLIFVILISLHYSIKISELTNHVKELAQQLAILTEHVRSEGEVKKD